MAITTPKKRPAATPAEIERFISGGMDKAAEAPAPASAIAPTSPVAVPIARPAPTAPVEVKRSSSRKHSISLTLDPALLAQIDEVADSMGISRAAAFAVGMSKWVAMEKRGAQ